MARLPNPLADVAAPLQRVEDGLTAVNKSVLPLADVSEEMVAVRAALEALLEEVRGLRADLTSGGAGRA